MNQPIVVFDSGFGGVTVLKEALKQLPNEDFVFYGDNKNVPYGIKGQKKIRELMDKVIEKILPLNPKALVIACNTATVSSANYLRNKYDLPIIGIEPAIKPALKDIPNDKRVLLLATETTSQSEKLTRLALDVDTDNRLDIFPLQNLVNFAENLQFSGVEVEEDITTLLSSYDFEKYESVVLGCTHFIWYQEFFQKILPKHIKLVDGNEGTVRQLGRVIAGNKSSHRTQETKLYFSNGLTKEAKDFLKEQLRNEIEFIEL